MTKVISSIAPDGAIKVSRQVVELINELSEVRSAYNSAKARVEELRKEVLSQVGTGNLTLIHHNIEVARVIESNPVRVDTKFLQENFPEAYEASLKSSQQFTIRSVTRQAK